MPDIEKSGIQIGDWVEIIPNELAVINEVGRIFQVSEIMQGHDCIEYLDYERRIWRMPSSLRKLDPEELTKLLNPSEPVGSTAVPTGERMAMCQKIKALEPLIRCDAIIQLEELYSKVDRLEQQIQGRTFPKDPDLALYIPKKIKDELKGFIKACLERGITIDEAIDRFKQCPDCGSLYCACETYPSYCWVEASDERKDALKNVVALLENLYTKDEYWLSVIKILKKMLDEVS